MTTTVDRKSAERAYADEGSKHVASTVCYLCLKYLFPGPQMRVWLRSTVVNREVTNRVGGAVIVSNHQAFLDHFVLPLHIRRRVRYWAKMDWWSTGVRGKLQGFFFSINNQVPVDRSGGNGAEAAIEVAVDCVKRGELFVIYPEGTRSPDGRIHRGRTGAARVAIRAGVPIIPSAVVGLFELQPAGRFFPKRGRYSLLFGEPIYPPAGITEDDDVAVRALTDQLMAEIVRLSGLEYTDEYARKRV